MQRAERVLLEVRARKHYRILAEIFSFFQMRFCTFINNIYNYFTPFSSINPGHRVGRMWKLAVIYGIEQIPKTSSFATLCTHQYLVVIFLICKIYAIKQLTNMYITSTVREKTVLLWIVSIIIFTTPVITFDCMKNSSWFLLIALIKHKFVSFLLSFTDGSCFLFEDDRHIFQVLGTLHPLTKFWAKIRIRSQSNIKHSQYRHWATTQILNVKFATLRDAAPTRTRKKRNITKSKDVISTRLQMCFSQSLQNVLFFKMYNPNCTPIK